MTLRAVFPNPNHLLLPGMYATAKISQAVLPNAYLIPQAAVTRLPTGQAIALIVNAKGAIETRPITTVGVKGQDWIVTEGLKVGDKVVVDGVAKVKEGQEVSAKPYQPQAKAPQGQNATPQASEQKQVNSPKAEQKATSQA